MRKRQWFKVGTAEGAMLTVADGGAAWWVSGLRPRVADQFQPVGQRFFLAVGVTILDGLLPQADTARACDVAVAAPIANNSGWFAR